MSAASALATPRTGFKFMLTVKAGPDQGAAYQLLPPRVTLGRGSDNNIVFSDPRVSRQAAIIEFSPERIVIKDLSNKATLIVNGVPVTEASIKDSDRVRIGDTEFVFVVEAIALNAAGVPQIPQTLNPGTPPPQMQIGGAAGNPFPGATRTHSYRPPPSMSSDDAGRARFYMIILVMGGILAWLFMSTSKQKPKEIELRTKETIERDLKTSEEKVVELEKKRTFTSDEERTRYEEAQKHYLEGFRDYQKGQWLRAMKSFETARAIDPEHQLSLRYFKLAEKQRDEMVAVLTLEGRSYKDKNMYKRCSAAFEKVLDAIPNKDDLKYKQAESLKKECDLLSEEKFR